MENINIAATSDSPEIIFNNEKKTFQIIGNSYPENCDRIYEPIKSFLNTLDINKQKELNFNFHFDLLNSTSTVYLAQIIVKISSLAKKGLITSVKWSYDEDDDELFELGERMAEISDLPFEYEAIKDED